MMILQLKMMILPLKNGDFGASRSSCFKEKGIKELKMKNFWRKTGEETDYLGINGDHTRKPPLTA